MSIRTMDRVWKNSIQSGGKLLLLLAIADFANDDGMAYPGIDTLAEKTRQSRRTVQRQLSELEDESELAIEPGTGRSNTNTYWVLAGMDPNLRQKHIEHCQALKGDKMTPFNQQIKGDISGLKGDISGNKRVTSDAENDVKGDIPGKKGDTAMTPEPLLTIKDNRQLSNRYEPSDLHKKIIAHFGSDLSPQNKKIVGLLKKCRPRADNSTLVLQTPNPDEYAWLSNRMEKYINRILIGIGGQIKTIRFELISTASQITGIDHGPKNQ